MSDFTVARDFIVHISALCPFCGSAYQVQATLRGQLVRCPHAACRKVFSVPVDVPPTEPPAAPAPPQPSPPPDNGQRSGSVGDMVPILPAEQAPPVESGGASKHVSEMLPLVPTEPAAPATGGRPAEGDWWQTAPPVRETRGQPGARPPAAPSSPPSTPATPWWGDAPPPVRNPQAPAASPAPAEPAQRVRPVRGSQTPAEPTQRIRPDAPASRETQQIPALSPRELPPGVWEPPPVRRGPASKEQGAQPGEETAASEAHRPRLSKRRAWLAIVGLFLLTFGVLGGASVWAWRTFHRSEEALSAEAHADYDQGSYSSAASKYSVLAQKFSDSPHAAEYRFLADWSAVCSVVSDPDADSSTAAARLDQFIKDHKKDPLTDQYSHDTGQQLLKLVKMFAARNENPPDEQPLKTAERIEQLRRTVAALGPDALTKEEAGQIDADLGKVRQAVEKARKRRNVLASLQPRAKETPMDAIKRARALLARMERELPGIGQDAEAQAALTRLEEAHRDSVVYQPRQEDAPLPPPRPDDDAKTLLFAPPSKPAGLGSAPPNDPIVLALVRGVLYALKQSTGEVKWATRVGIDTTVLPKRVPASQASPELLLVLSADTQTLSALRTDNGESLWEYPVGQRVLGRPIIIDHRAYLAAYDGWIHEIELSGGQLLGRWYLGQRLTRGGTRESDTSSRIYFPADDSCIYVLDVSPTSRRCVAILDDGHPSGSLRSEPIIIPPEGDNAPGYLILNEASGLDAMRLRVFELPLQDRHAAPLPLKPPARLPGWTWFEPYQDGEKLAVLSDAGRLGLFGIRQPGNRDQALFPLLQPGGLDLSPFLQNERKLPLERGRAQVVHMQGDDLWVLAHGRLQLMQLRWKEKMGRQAAAGWKEPLTLGSPLHEPQRIEDRNGRSTFFLVTQALEQQTCLASAVDEEGKILWQRQLGLVCQGEPLALTPPSGGPPMLLALDQGGGLFVLDPPHKPRPSGPSRAAALEENPRVPPRLLPAPDGHSAYEVAAPGDGRSLLLRRIEWSEGVRALRVKESKVSLVSLADNSVLIPAGPPAVVGAQLIVPMTDGTLRRLSLAEPDKPQPGPNWRDNLAPLTAPCNVLALGGDRFLITDGSRGLSVYEWPLGKEWQPLPAEGESLKRLEYPIAAPPVLLPSHDGPPRVAVADSAGVLHLFTVAPDGSLQPGLTWDLQGKLTMGPFVHATPEGGLCIGCVLDRSRLIWLDPAKAEPLWIYSSGGAALVGQPRQIEDLLVVALQSGHYLGLDPRTGRPKGAGYTLRTSAAPAATPMPFGPGLMFTPLSDGTALLLSVERLREPAKK